MNYFKQKPAKPNNENIILIDDIRISIISERIIRIERKPFTDLKTQIIINRDLGKIEYTYKTDKKYVYIKTKAAEYRINIKTLKVEVVFDDKTIKPKKRKNLKGTYRTLDMCIGSYHILNGFIKLEDGIFSKDGVVLLKDNSALLNEDGSISKVEREDYYVFAFQDEYLLGLKEFSSISGYSPLLPKYALSNWWSRYYDYTQDEYLSLLNKFKEKDIPFNVAVIDMDWHLVDDIPSDIKKDGVMPAGWTGYTFNKTKFPDHVAFFKELKERNMAITLNLHPKSGIRYYEEQYKEMAIANNINPDTKQRVEFDFTNMTFINSYFDLVLHPYEKEGVDFWWIDWQQGTESKIKGVDPLWLLNHYHTLDIKHSHKDGIILSRYSGLGSQRYPLGFSGDTIVSFGSLKYQIYFTLTASNCDYTWWSHDIGGHMGSKGNSELYTRWIQFGVFSPINRLHSSKCKWSKEPWLYSKDAEKVASDFLRLRHSLLPFLYTANIETHNNATPLIMPMYYLDKSDISKTLKYQYYFTKNMIVAPVFSRMKNGFSKTKVYLPDGNWSDFFTDEAYIGGRRYEIESPLSRIPVFVKEGSIIPLLNRVDYNSLEFRSLKVRFYLGNSSYTMYDENSHIDFKMEKDDEKVSITIIPSENTATKEIEIEPHNFKDYNIEESKLKVILNDNKPKIVVFYKQRQM